MLDVFSIVYDSFILNLFIGFCYPVLGSEYPHFHSTLGRWVIEARKHVSATFRLKVAEDVVPLISIDQISKPVSL